MSLATILDLILAPPFLVNNLQLIAFVASAMVLVFFDDFVCEKIIFPVADFFRFKIFKHVGNIYGKNRIRSWWAKFTRKYVSEAVATILVIFYCYSGSVVLGIYVFEPIFQRWKSIILLVVIVMFLLSNYIINDSRMRKRFFGLEIYNPDKK